ncbi:MAG: hypothetical protein LBR24_00250, partial [Methanobrevibacter sp.]|nr:hypothetical protein [Methanobrevibacter sp.]
MEINSLKVDNSVNNVNNVCNINYLELVNNLKLNRFIAFFIGILFFTVLFMSLSCVSSVDSTYLGTVDAENKYNLTVNNTNAPDFVDRPKYVLSKNYAKTKGIETKKNTISSKLGKKYKFV